MKIPIVNEQDEVIAYKEREETNREDIRRIVSLVVFNQNKEVLIAKRHKDKLIDPNVWGPSVAGTVDEGFDYDETVVKEAEEEIGLTNVAPIFLSKIYYENEKSRRWCSRYYLVINSDNVELKKQDSEVSELKWISLENLEKWFDKNPEEFILSFSGSLQNMKDIYKIIYENKN